MTDIERYYSITVKRHDDPMRGASFWIEPAVQWVTEEEGAERLTAVIRRLILDRMYEDEDKGLALAITHNFADGSATVGRANFEGLARATGVVMLQQALELGLNGTDQFISSNSPLRMPDAIAE